MADSFDDFARKHQQEQVNRKRLESETKPEWEIMKGFVSQFAADNKGIGGHRFEWELSLTGRHMLRLNNVSALLINDANYGGSERTYGVRFSRRPTGSREVFIDDPPYLQRLGLLSPEFWTETSSGWLMNWHESSLQRLSRMRLPKFLPPTISSTKRRTVARSRPRRHSMSQ